jgi:hypothetical protein
MILIWGGDGSKVRKGGDVAAISKKLKMEYCIRRSYPMEIAYTYWEADDGWLVG